MKEETYEIYTDASFDHKNKVGTYSIVIIHNEKLEKVFAKKCNVKLENSTECEIFAIFQAINVIEGNIIKKEKSQEFLISTDCEAAPIFFTKKERKGKNKIFKTNIELYNIIKKTYKRTRKKLSKQGCSFKIRYISRKNNKIAHNYSYKAFKKIKIESGKSEFIFIEKKLFLQFLQNFNSKKYNVINYLFQISNKNNIISRTQIEVAEELGLSISTVNKIFQELIKLKMLMKLENGKYNLLI